MLPITYGRFADCIQRGMRTTLEIAGLVAIAGLVILYFAAVIATLRF